MKIRIAIGHTLNVGNFESVRVDLAVEDDTDDPETYLKEQLKWLDKKMPQVAKRAYAEHKAIKTENR